MDGNVVLYELKFKKLLEKFLEPDFHIQNDVYFNTLLSHLSGKDNKELGDTLLNLPLFMEWIIQACTFWEKNAIRPSPTISSFILQLTSLLSKDEEKFAYFKTYNTFNSLCVILKVKSPESSPSIKLAYIKMLSAFLNHRSGIDWLISTDCWRDAMNYCLENQTVYIIREGYKFMCELLRKSVDYNEIFCNLVIKQIVMKLSHVPCQNGIIYPEVNEELVQKHVSPILRLIVNILESYLDSNLTKENDYRVPIIFLRAYQLESCVWKISMVAANTEFVYDIDKTLICIYFIELLIRNPVEIIPCNEVKSLGINLIKVINLRINKKAVNNVLKSCHYTDYLWQFLLPRLPTPTTELALLRSENQLLPIELCPLLMVTFKHCCFPMKDFELDDLRDDFITKIFKSMSEQTTRLAFQWKEMLFNLDDDMFVFAQQAISYIMYGRKTYRRSRAVIIFQTCIYSFKDLTKCVKENPVKGDVFIQNSSFLVSLITALSTFINEYNITWRESVETICVLSVTLDFLNLTIWSPRVVVEALKLLNLSIAKYMSPNLALLLDETKDSALDLVGPLLCLKLHDTNWEVRDSALEILNTVSTLAYTKFPSFRKIVLESDLITLVVTMSLSDSEGFVRASAIKCLQEMIKITEFWNPVLLQRELPQKIMRTLQNETEAIVRTQAACLMKCIYEHQAFPEEMMEQVYDSMAYAATLDLHWEVKTNALDFWGKVVLNHLQHQGMIDGKFPDVTFSKEHRKIVTLTETEIKNRLSKVLRQLSKCGCLGVLVSAMQDDCDLEVTKRAVDKAKKILKLFDMYNFKAMCNGSSNLSSPSSKESCSPCYTAPYPSPSLIFNPMNTPPVTPKVDYADDVIDQIINSTDINLLTDVYNPNQNVIATNENVQSIKNVTPELFLSFIQKDLDIIVNEKARWLNNIDDLHSLLDDMLKSYNEDINSMDCY